MSKILIYNGQEIIIDLSSANIYNVDGNEYEVSNNYQNQNEVTFIVNGRKQKCYAAESGDDIFVFINGSQFQFTKPSSIRRKSSNGITDGSVSSPMPGNLIKLNVVKGDEVNENDILAVVEAMKMENPLRAPFSGKVVAINYEVGDLVDSGKTIIQIENKD